MEHKLISGTDLASSYPEVAKEFNVEANYPLTPEQVTAFSNKRVWWKCNKRGHEWEAPIYSRTKGCGCPYCAGRLPIVGETDLASIYPELSKEFDLEANSPLTPEQVTAFSHKRVWWKCNKRGHEWEAPIYSRTRGCGCPYCAGRLPIVGETDLASRFPELSKEFDLEANNPLTPQQVTAYSHKKVWWRCKEKQHKWEATVSDRANGYGCPYCARRRPIVGETDLASRFPELSKEFDLEANNPLTPEQLAACSNRKVWWRCKEKKHKWEATVSARTHGRGCPYCIRRLPIVGETDLSSRFPELAKDFDLEANYPLTPEKVSVCAKKKVWWKCENGHKWKMAIYYRTRGHGCPYCCGR